LTGTIPGAIEDCAVKATTSRRVDPGGPHGGVNPAARWVITLLSLGSTSIELARFKGQSESSDWPSRGEKEVLIDRANWPLHRPWVLFVVLATVGAGAWYVVESGSTSWPGGASLPGFTFGALGGLIVIFEFLLWFRKKVRVWRIGQAQTWMRAHIWLGLLCVPLLIGHSGFRWGGTLSAVLMILLLVVIASGIWGLALQQLLPRRMLDDLPAETIYSQIGRLADELVAEAEHLVRATCGPAPGEETETIARAQAPTPDGSFLVVGAARSVGRVQGNVLETRVPPNPVPESEMLRDFFRNTVAPFLRSGNASPSPLRNFNRTAALFQDLRAKLPPPAHASADGLERLCNQRRQWAEQARLHVWLHSWLWVHFPLSVALVLLMFVHAWVALKYW
jgi:hypothetical protein